jgi:hypothetical protein
LITRTILGEGFTVAQCGSTVVKVLRYKSEGRWFDQSATGSWSVRTYRLRSAHTELSGFIFSLECEWIDIHWKDIRKTNQIITTNR